MRRLMLAPLVLLLALLGAACDPSQNPYVDIGTPFVGEPAEDDPDWDCHVHGNGVCGPLTAALWSDGRVDVFDADGNPVEYQGIGDDGSGDLLVFLVNESHPLRVYAENITYPDQ